MMNDFTKDELLEILGNMRALRSYSAVETSAMNKIHSLIDNYCEHESGDPKLVFIKECTKCHQHLETRPWRFRHAWSFIDDQE